MIAFKIHNKRRKIVACCAKKFTLHISKPRNRYRYIKMYRKSRSGLGLRYKTPFYFALSHHVRDKKTFKKKNKCHPLTTIYNAICLCVF